MLALFSLLLLLYVTLFLARIATILLVYTGVSQEIARFQAWSAITGCGFTTSEAEQVVDHPLRRRVIRILMLFGNIGIIAAMASAILGFISHDVNSWVKLAVMVGGLGLLWGLACSRKVEYLLARWLDRLLRKQAALSFSNYSNLYRLPAGYRISLTVIDRNSPWREKTVGDCPFSKYHVILLGIQHPRERFKASPAVDAVIRDGDSLTFYALQSDLEQMITECTAPQSDSPKS